MYGKPEICEIELCSDIKMAEEKDERQQQNSQTSLWKNSEARMCMAKVLQLPDFSFFNDHSHSACHVFYFDLSLFQKHAHVRKWIFQGKNLQAQVLWAHLHAPMIKRSGAPLKFW